MALSVFAKIVNWAGGVLSPADFHAGDGSQIIPTVRNASRRYGQLLFSGPMAASQTFVSQWFDTNQTGDIYAAVTVYSAQISASFGFLLQETDDPSDANLLQNTTVSALAGYGTGTIVAANTLTTIYAFPKKRYWRTSFQNGPTPSASTKLYYNTSQNLQFSVPASGLNGFLPGATSIATVAISTTLVDGAINNPVLPVRPDNAAVLQSNYPMAFNGATWDRQRTPVVYRGGQFSAAGQNIIWTPQTSKKFRLMSYEIEAAEDITISGGPLPINLAWTQVLPSNVATATTIAGFNLPQFTHRLVVPAAVLATSFEGYLSGQVDLGNGSPGTAASYPLAMGIMVPQAIGVTNPAWTIPSNQWEAAQIGFKTDGARGNFKLVQSATVVGTASVASIALPSTAFSKGNSIFVFIRYTKVVGGAATITVTDTAGNTYTVSAQTANASDGANGSAIAVAYAINIPSSASLSANVITVNYGTNNAAASSILMLEYSGMGSGGIDAALVGASGNSTTPASGNYTSVVAGDLLFALYGTAANVAALPTVGSNFRLINGTFAATSGSLGVADNFGNGAISTGVINVITMGTEE